MKTALVSEDRKYTRKIEEASWRPLYGGEQGGRSLNQEASWRPLYGGAQGGTV